MPQFQTRLLDARRQQMYVVSIFILVVLVFALLSIITLYRTAFEEEKARLAEAAQSQARLMEEVARFDSEYSHNFPGGTEAATLHQFIEAHKKFKGFGKTGEFLLAREEDGSIVFVLSHRHFNLTLPQPIPLNSERSPYLTRALQGESGIMVARDYRNIEVLAAFEHIPVLNLGLVAKIDLDEIREPFFKAGIITFSAGVIILMVGIFIILRLSDPMVTEIVVNRKLMRSLYFKLDATREDEKARIARDVHDELGQTLTALKIELCQLIDDIKDGKKISVEKIEGMDHLTDATIESVQRICTELRPQILDVCGLGEAIRFVGEEHLRRGLIVDTSKVDMEVSIKKELATTLFRVFQEALTNVLRHANATKTTVRLYNDKDFIFMEVEDNGSGIDPEQLNKPSSLGLHGMRERLTQWGGEIKISPGPEGGTRVWVKIPMDAHEKNIE